MALVGFFPLWLFIYFWSNTLLSTSTNNSGRNKSRVLIKRFINTHSLWTNLEKYLTKPFLGSSKKDFVNFLLFFFLWYLIFCYSSQSPMVIRIEIDNKEIWNGPKVAGLPFLNNCDHYSLYWSRFPSCI